jgi:hypothetical protein
MKMNVRYGLIAAALLASSGAVIADEAIGDRGIELVVVAAKHAPLARAQSHDTVLASSKEVLSAVAPEIALPKIDVAVPKL